MMGPIDSLQQARVEGDLLTVSDGTHGTRGWDERRPGYEQEVIAWIAARLGLAGGLKHAEKGRYHP
jgi:hypothetical protein